MAPTAFPVDHRMTLRMFAGDYMNMQALKHNNCYFKVTAIRVIVFSSLFLYL